MFFSCLNDRMQIHESIGTKVGPKASGVLEFNFEFSDAAFGSVVVGRYCRVSKKVEDVVATFEQAVFERCELLVQFRQVLVNKFVQPVKPRLCVNGFCRLLTPFMALSNSSLSNSKSAFSPL